MSHSSASPEQIRPGLLLDEAWGGLDRGGCYLILGRASAGLHLPALHLVRAAAERAEPCLYLSALAPEALAHESDRIGFDVAGAVRDGRVRLLRMPASLVREEPDDAARARAFANLAALVEANRPALLVLDGFAPMARFSAFASFAAAFAALHERLAATGTTVVLTMDEPANAAAERVVAFVRERATGSAHLTGDPDSTLRTLALHDDVDPAPPEGIKYLDLSTASASAPPADSFSTLSYGVALSGRGHFVSAGNARRDGQRRFARADADPFAHALLGTTTAELCAPDEYAAATIDADVFEDVDLSAALQLFAPPPLPAEPPPAPAPPDPRMAFVLAFNEALAARADGGEPFLAVALQMLPDHPSARHFHFVVRAVEGTLGAQDRLLADEARGGLVVLLSGRTAGTAQLLFATLKTFLRDATSEADHILQAVSALVVPDGRPFPNATEFLLHAFDKG